MISLQLERMDGDSVAIQLNRKSIATYFLSVTRLETFSESRSLRDTRHQFLALWDRIHLADHAPAAIYLDVLLSYTDVDGDRVTARPGSERVAAVASICLLRVLSSVGPTSNVFEDTRRRYFGVIPRMANFEGPLCHAITATHALLVSSQERRPFGWINYKPCAQEYASFTNTLVQVAYNRGQHGKVPRWVLRFALHSIPQDPPISVVADFLSIIAIDLGCVVPSAKSAVSDERCVQL